MTVTATGENIASREGGLYAVDPTFIPNSEGRFPALENMEKQEEFQQVIEHFSWWLDQGDGRIIRRLKEEYPDRIDDNVTLSLYITYCAASAEKYVQVKQQQATHPGTHRPPAEVRSLDDARSKKFSSVKMLAVAATLALGAEGAQQLVQSQGSSNSPVIALANHPTAITQLASQLTAITETHTKTANLAQATVEIDKKTAATIKELTAQQPQSNRAATPQGEKVVKAVIAHVDTKVNKVIADPKISVAKKIEVQKERAVVVAGLQFPDLLSTDLTPQLATATSADAAVAKVPQSTQDILGVSNYDTPETAVLGTLINQIDTTASTPVTTETDPSTVPSTNPTTPVPSASPSTEQTPQPSTDKPTPTPDTPSNKPTPAPTKTPSKPTPAPETQGNLSVVYDINTSILSKSGVTALEFNQIFQNTGFAGLGDAFLEAEKTYGINALFTAAHAMIEAGPNGDSQFARERNNIFGIAAYDTNTNAAKHFPTKADCVVYYAQLLTNHYLQPGQDEFAGATAHGIFTHYSTSHDTEATSVVTIMNNLEAKAKQIQDYIVAVTQQANQPKPTPAPSNPEKPTIPSSSEIVDCPSGANDLGIHQGYHKGVEVDIRLCAIPGVPSTSEESNQGPNNGYYIDGANGNVIVNAAIAQNVIDMVAAAKKDGIDLSAVSSFRTDAHQSALYDQYNHDGNLAAPPHFSNHQYGMAIDWNLNGLPIRASYYNFEGDRRVAPQSPVWVWLLNNAQKYGFMQYKNEPWHWSPTAS